MEEYNQQQADDELSSSKKKKRRESFFSSWLQRRHLPLDLGEKSDKAKSTETKKSSLSERLSNFLRKPFKKQVEVAYVTTGLEPETTKTDRFQPAPADWFETRTNVENRDRDTASEANDNTDVSTASELKQAEASTEKSSEYEGLLLVSEESKRRYRDEQIDTQTTKSSEVQQEFGQIRGSDATKEKVKVVNESIDDPIMPTNELGLSTGEFLRRQRERKLRKEVQHLKKDAVSTKQEQQEVKKQQLEFQRLLDKQAKQRRELAEKRVPKLETTVNQIQSNQEKPAKYKTPQPERFMPLKDHDDILPPIQEQPQEEKYAEIIQTPPQRPEMVLQTVENAAEQNVPIENLYERRHEVKDNPSQPADSHTMAGASFTAPSNLRSYNAPPQLIPMSPPQPLDASNAYAPQSAREVYKQAALSGFWTAIIICILLLVLMWMH